MSEDFFWEKEKKITHSNIHRENLIGHAEHKSGLVASSSDLGAADLKHEV